METKKKTFDERVAELDAENKAKGLRKMIILGLGKDEDIAETLRDLADRYEQGELKDLGKNICVNVSD